MGRSRSVVALAAAAVVGVVTHAFSAESATPIPIPKPAAEVKTISGSVQRTTFVPIGGAPVPIDVDDGGPAGLLKPDIDFSVGLIALTEFPEHLVVPNILIKRNATAIVQRRVAPPLDITSEIVLFDGANGVEEIARVEYGYETPPGGRVPPVVHAKLIGPIAGGFIDPLLARLDTPGYDGPLLIKVKATTPALVAGVAARLDPMPGRIDVGLDPVAEGLDLDLEHTGNEPDVQADVLADISDRVANSRVIANATIERVPSRIDIDLRERGDRSTIEYRARTPLADPDIRTNFTAFDGADVAVDATAKVTGLPPHLKATIDTIPDGDGGKEVDAVDLEVLDGGAVKRVEVEARNYLGDAGPVPERNLGPDEHVAIATRTLADGTTRFWASARVEQIRHVRYAREGDDNNITDLVADVGDGVKPLKLFLDTDDRGGPPPAEPPPVTAPKPSRMSIDATIDPLPEHIHARITAPVQITDTTTLDVSEATRRYDVDADMEIDAGDAEGCGNPEVTCVTAALDRVPPRLVATLPGDGGTDYLVSSEPVATRADARLHADVTPADPADRIVADVAALGLPPEIAARIDTTDKGVLRAAEFHACAYDFGARECTSPLDRLDRAEITLRPRPDRDSLGLPEIPDHGRQFVSVIQRDEVTEVVAGVDAVRHVALRQRDADDDGKADGTLGALVEVGAGDPFDVHVDQKAIDQALMDDLAADDVTPVEPLRASTQVDARVDTLPTSFVACIREATDAAPPSPRAGSDPAFDPLLDDCERTDVLGATAEQPLSSTPLSLHYDAATSTKVSAHVVRRAHDREDGLREHVQEIAATVNQVPGLLDLDLVPSAEPVDEIDGDDVVEVAPGRALRASYRASAPLDNVLLDVESRRTDGTPHRDDVYVNADVDGIPAAVALVVDSARRVVRRAEFHACDWDFVSACATGTEDPVDSATVLVRNRRERPSLPPQPEGLGESFVSVLGRVVRPQLPDRPESRQDFEVSGRFTDIGRVVLLQPDRNRDGDADGLIGAQVRSGAGGPFDVHLDQVAFDDEYLDRPETTRPRAHTVTDAHVDALPSTVTVCMRRADDAPPVVVEGGAAPPPLATSGDPFADLIAPCEPDAVLGYGGSGPPLPGTPLTVDYEGAPTGLDLRMQRRALDRQDGERPHVTDMTVDVGSAPASLHADLLPGRDVDGTAGADGCIPAAGGRPPRPTRFAYSAGAPILDLDIELEERRADGTIACSSTFTHASVDRVPSILSGQIDSRLRVARRVDVAACLIDFATGACPSPPTEGLTGIDVLQRTTRARGDLPPVPQADGEHLSAVRRGDRSEVSGHVAEVRQVSMRQRDETGPDDAPDGKPDGPLGFALNLGGEPTADRPFALHVDQVAPDSRLPGRQAEFALDATLDRLPATFSGCVRPEAAESPSTPPDAEPLLAGCERTTGILGRTEDGPPLTSTPLSLRYSASTPTIVTADLRSRAPEPEDGDRDHISDLRARIEAVPATIDLDLISARDGKGADARRPMELDYHASTPITKVDVVTSKQRADGSQSDEGTFADLTLTGVPTDVGGIVDVQDGVANAVEVQACDFDPVAKSCRGERGQVGSVELLARPLRARGGLPPAVVPRDGDHVSLSKRFENFEVSAGAQQVKGLAVRQRDPDGPAGDAGVIGFAAFTGARRPLTIHLDQLDADARFTGADRPNASTVVDASIDALPTELRGCLRTPARAVIGAASGDPLLGACERGDVLDRPASGEGALTTTPMSIDYRASSSVGIDATVTQLAADRDDGDRQHRQHIVADVRDVPGGVVDDELQGVRVDVVPPSDDDTRPLEAQYAADDDIGRIDLELEAGRVDGTRADDSVFLDASVTNIPKSLAARLARSGELVSAADVHACDFDFVALRCEDTTQAIGAVDIVARPTRARGALPPVDPEHAPSFLSVITRQRTAAVTDSEVRGHVERVKGVALRQLDVETENDPDGGPDGNPDGLTGFSVAAGDGDDPFDLLLDQSLFDERYPATPRPFTDRRTTIVQRPRVDLRLKAGVERLPESISGCVRQERDRAPVDVSDDPLLVDCQTETVGGQPVSSTPFTVSYEAPEGATPVTTDLEVRALDPDDEDRLALVDLTTRIDAVPDSIVADVITPRPADAEAGTPPRDLRLHYDASSVVTRVDLELEKRRATSLCRDPRPNRLALCIDGRLTDIPGVLDATLSDSPGRTLIDVTADELPASGVGPTVGPLTIQSTQPAGAPLPGCPATDDGSIVIAVDLTAKNLPQRLHGDLRKADIDRNGCTPLELGAVDFSACPEGADPDDPVACPGIERVSFAATNLIEPSKPPFELTESAQTGLGELALLLGAQDRVFRPKAFDPAPGVSADHTFDVVRRGGGFRASGSVGDLRRITYSQVDELGRPTATTRINVGFGGAEDERLDASVDSDDGVDKLKLDATVRQAPQTVALCLRDAVADIPVTVPSSGSIFTQLKGITRTVTPLTARRIGTVGSTQVIQGPPVDSDSPIFCERQDPHKLALQVDLGSSASGARPDVAINELELDRAGGLQHIEGSLEFEDIGSEISLLQDKRETMDLVVQGPTDAAGNVVGDAVGRGTFDIRTYDRDLVTPQQLAARGFPFRSLDAEAGVTAAARILPEPETDDEIDVLDEPAAYPGEPDEDGSAGDDTPTERNFLKLQTDGLTVEAKGSIPSIRRVAVKPRPCDEADPRFPPAAAFGTHPVPSYMCFDADAAAKKVLGLTIRALIEGQAIAFDGGKLDTVPDDGLALTIALSEGTTERVCKSVAQADEGDRTCRPPQMLAEARGSTTRELSGKLGIGKLGTLRRLKEDVQPLDELSQRIDYEQSPRDYPQQGGRLRVGSGELVTFEVDDLTGQPSEASVEEQFGVLLGVRRSLPDVIVLDPPTLYACEREEDDDDEPCAEDAASPEDFDGRAATDIKLKVVGSNDDGSGRLEAAGNLGRWNALIHDFTPGADPKQVIIGGPPPGAEARDVDADINESRAVPLGDVTLERLSTYPGLAAGDAGDAANAAGAQLPGHLEIEVSTRDRYDAAIDESSVSYAQVDGRFSQPVSATVRMNRGGSGHGKNRIGDRVPDTQLAILDAPGPAPGNEDLADPTFRVRAAIMQQRQGPNPAVTFLGCEQPTGELNTRFLILIAVRAALRATGLRDVCLNIPDPKPAYLNVLMDANPGVTSGEVARTVDAVVDLRLIDNDVDIRGTDKVQTPDSPEKGDPVGIDAEAEVRLDRFDLGISAEAGLSLFRKLSGALLGIPPVDIPVLDDLLDVLAGIGLRMESEGDLRFDLEAFDADKVRLGQRVLKVGIDSTSPDDDPSLSSRPSTPVSNTVRLDGELNTRGSFEAYADLIGLDPIELFNVDAGFARQQLLAAECDGAGPDRNFDGGDAGGIFELSTRPWDVVDQRRVAGLSLGFGGDLDFVANPIGMVLSGVTSLLRNAPGLPFAGCADDPTMFEPKVTDDFPAPPFDEPGRPLPGVEEAEPPDPGQPTPPPTDLELLELEVPEGETRLFCGTVDAKTITVRGTMQAGSPGERHPDGTGRPVDCTGDLEVAADNLLVAATGVVSASATQAATGPGTPSSGRGGGGGHHEDGGASGDGSPGGAAYANLQSDPDNPRPDAGSPGRRGSSLSLGGTVQGGDPGAGGGALHLTARERLRINGRVLADGGAGQAGTAIAGACTTGGGGGSGGNVTLDSARVTLGETALVSASGGPGATDDFGGGGGAGGRVRVDSVVRTFESGSQRLAAPGAAGATAGDCAEGADGAPGGGGAAGQGTQRVRVAWVEEQDRTAPSIRRFGSPGVTIRAIQKDGGPLEIVLCDRSVSPSEIDDPARPFDDPALNPPSEANTPDELIEFSNGGCQGFLFATPNVGDDEYAMDLPFHPGEFLGDLDDGFHGLFALAAEPDLGNPTFTSCLGGVETGTFIDALFSADCVYQTTLPKRAQVRFALDTERPEILTDQSGPASGDDGCPESSRCVTSRDDARVDLAARDTFQDTNATFSGIAEGTVFCHVNPVDGQTNTARVPCELAEGVPVPLLGVGGTGGDGRYNVALQVLDNVGHPAADELDPVQVARFWLDSRRPDRPALTMDFGSAPNVSGWFRVPPVVTVTASDPGAKTSGLKADAVTVRIGSEERPCGAESVDGDVTCVLQPVLSGVGPQELQIVPRSGRHVFRATVEDRAGNQSRESDGVEMLVDHAPPTSTVILGPGTPDGAQGSGWYRSRPLISFAAADNPGGSGIDLAHAIDDPDTDLDDIDLRFAIVDTGVVDDDDDLTGGREFDRNQDVLLGDGVDRRVCWFAVDIAGNREVTRCSDPVKVDSTDPTVAVEIFPLLPSGLGQWYTATPSFRVIADDPGAEASGLAARLVSLDGGDYTPYAGGLVPIADGRHEVCAVARDVAGNESEPVCQIVQVDTEAPDLASPHVDPDTRVNGFLSRRPVVDASASDSGSGVSEPGMGISLGTSAALLEPYVPQLATPDADGRRRAAPAPFSGSQICRNNVDAAGNPARLVAVCEPLHVDDTAPSVSIALDPASPDATPEVYGTAPRFTVTATDAGSGIDLARGPSDVLVAVDGDRYRRYDPGAANRLLGSATHEVCAVAIDVAGNRSTPVCRTAVVDAAPPSVRLFTDPPQADGDAGWFVTQPTLIAAAVDEPGGTGVRATDVTIDGASVEPAYDDDERPVLPNGTYRVCAVAEDGGENVAEDCDDLKVDDKAPTVTLTAPTISGHRSYDVTTPTVTAAGADSGGSGLSRVELSLDGAPFAPAASLAVPDGRHVVAARAVDVAGNTSAIVRRTVLVDTQAPATRLDAFPSAPNARGWYRVLPAVQVGIADPEPSSGADLPLLSVNGNPGIGLFRPFVLSDGISNLIGTGRDLAGNGSTATGQIKTDQVPPTPAVVGAQVNNQGGTTRTVTLKFRAADPGGGRSRVRVFVLGGVGQAVIRTLPVASGGYLAPGDGQVTWDLRNDAGNKVLAGAFTFRVQAVDEAGNAASSSESALFTVVL